MPPINQSPLLALLACGICLTTSAGLSAEEAPLRYPGERAGYEAPEKGLQPTPAGEEQAQGLTIPFGRQVAHIQSTTTDSTSEPAAKLPPRGNDTLSLAPPSDKQAKQGADTSGALPSFFSVLVSLSVVLGIFFLFAWLVKKSLPKGTTQLPSEVVEVLGRTLLAPRQYVHLIRIGNKLLLVSMTAAGAETLTEITDPLQVDRLAGLCEKSHPFSSTNAFRQVFQQFGNKANDHDLEIADTSGASSSKLKPAFEQSHV